MAVTVRIHFVGLCFFARQGNTRTHVLLPASGITHAGHQVEPHVARISVNAKGKPYEDLDHLAMKPIASTGGNTLPDKVPNLSKLKGKPGLRVRGDVLQDCPKSDDLFAKFTLDGGTLEPGSSALWKFEGEDRCMSNEIIWTSEELTLPGNALTLTGCSMRGGSDKQFGPYKPGANGQIELFVLSLPISELTNPPVDPEPDTPARHFAAYHPLMAGNHKDLPIPTFKDEDCAAGTVHPAGPAGIMPVTCMVGGGDG